MIIRNQRRRGSDRRLIGGVGIIGLLSAETNASTKELLSQATVVADDRSPESIDLLAWERKRSNQLLIFDQGEPFSLDADGTIQESIS